MSNAQIHELTPRKPLRLWPGVALAILMVLFRFGAPAVFADALEISVLSGLIFGLAIVVWWAFFSRAAGVERWGAIVLMVVAALVTSRLIDKSIATGMMHMMFPVYAVPTLTFAFVVWAAATSRLSDQARRVTMVATVVLVCAVWTMLRTGGITGDAVSDIAWRWAPTPEERLLAREKPVAIAATPQPVEIAPAPVAAKISKEPEVAASAAHEPAAPSVAVPAEKTGANWPGFRGPHRDGIVPGVSIDTDWTASPPVKMWGRPIGPGWSSFAVQGDLLYTQEQRGTDEVVSCYQVSTGEPVWKHSDPARFWESNGGAGPRGTPTLSNGRVYAFGATGILNALDARTGAVVWSRNAGVDSGRTVPEWGFASSPWVIEDMVIIAAAGELVAYDLATGKPRWFGPNERGGYSSPHPFTLDGVAQILLTGGAGLVSVSPADGTKLWEYALPPNAPIVQPAVMPEGDILISEGEGHGLRRIAVSHGAAGWTVEERWRSIGLKPYFNDFAIHNGHAFGFDGNILSCIDVKDGKRIWKGGRYGDGQLVLLPDQELLLVLSEEGELALVSAAPDQFKELGRVPAIEGKTWNHPVLAGNVLLVRNGQEMAAFRLAPSRR